MSLKFRNTSKFHINSILDKVLNQNKILNFKHSPFCYPFFIIEFDYVKLGKIRQLCEQLCETYKNANIMLLLIALYHREI